jgi:hypothetical protein
MTGAMRSYTRYTKQIVGWVKEQSDVPIRDNTPWLTGTLRFTRPTVCRGMANKDAGGSFDRAGDALLHPLYQTNRRMGKGAKRRTHQDNAPWLTGTLRFTR